MTVRAFGPLGEVRKHLMFVTRGRFDGPPTVAPIRNITVHPRPIADFFSACDTGLIIVRRSRARLVWIRIKLALFTPGYLGVRGHAGFGAYVDGTVAICQLNHE